MTKRICVIGGGRWGRNHIRTLAGSGNLAAIVEADPERLAGFLGEYPGVAGHTSVDEAIAARYDGYTVALPAELHYPVGKKLIEQGLNVMMEKPMTLTAAQSEELVEMAGRSGSRLMVGHVLMFHPAIRKIREVIEGGELGELFYIYSNRLNLGAVRTEESVFASFAPHDVSLLDYLVGSPACRVDARGGSFLQPGICDTTLALLEYPGGVRGHIHVSWLHPFKQQLLVVVGSRGMISFDDASPEKTIAFHDKRVDFADGLPVLVDNPVRIIPYEKKMPLEEELRYFVEHLDSEIEINSGRAGLNVVRVLETVQSIIDKDGK